MDKWISVVSELLCRRELTNWKDQFPVTVTKDSTIVGVPKIISSICLLFLEASVAALYEVDSISMSYHKGL